MARVSWHSYILEVRPNLGFLVHKTVIMILLCTPLYFRVFSLFNVFLCGPPRGARQYPRSEYFLVKYIWNP